MSSPKPKRKRKAKAKALSQDSKQATAPSTEKNDHTEQDDIDNLNETSQELSIRKDSQKKNEPSKTNDFVR